MQLANSSKDAPSTQLISPQPRHWQRICRILGRLRGCRICFKLPPISVRRLSVLKSGSEDLATHWWTCSQQGQTKRYTVPSDQFAMLGEGMEALRPVRRPHEFDTATIGALAHLYRGEIYRSTIWRTRLDNTTNWAVVTLGIALSVTFSSQEASPLPLLLAGILSIVFLIFEARRYRYFNVWRARARWLERNFYAPMLRGEDLKSDTHWTKVLANDYCEPRHHISLARAMGRRLRRNYIWILGIQTVAYYGKIAIHPVPVSSLSELVRRASLGPIPGELMLLAGVIFSAGWIGFAAITLFLDRAKHGPGPRVTMG
jgi:uncharacterized membrane protein